jgi:dipeptidyl aminopeptidase/acylaminoacyl peptidase
MKYIIFALLPFLVSVVFVGTDTFETRESERKTDRAFVQDLASSSADSASEPTASESALPTVSNEVSLPALMRRDFSGSDFELGTVLAENAAYTRYAISYQSDGLNISGIMNIPNGDGPYPLLVLNHGYIDPAVYTRGRGLKREQDYFARNGYAVIHPDYRNHAFSDDDPDEKHKARIDYTIDVINAIKAVQKAELPAVDATRIGMMGHSMGGGIAQNVAVSVPNLVDAHVLYAPVSGDYYENFQEYIDEPDESGVSERAQKIIDRYGAPEENPAFWNGVSAKTYYDRIVSPVMIHIGTQDESTPPQWSQDINDRLESAGKDVTLHVYEGETHEFIPQWDTMMQRSEEFFNTHVK